MEYRPRFARGQKAGVENVRKQSLQAAKAEKGRTFVTSGTEVAESRHLPAALPGAKMRLAPIPAGAVV
jgi:hypothetical protein